MQAQIVPIVILSAWLVSPTTALSQPIERAQDLKPFSTLELRGCFDTRLVPGAANRITVSATAEQHDKIRIEQDGDTLTVGPTEWGESWNGWNSWCRGSTIKVLVSANFAKDKTVELNLRGSGDLDAEVPAAAKLTATVAGSGDVALRGSAGACEITIAGSGSVAARALECAATTEVAVRGSGDAVLRGKTKSCEFAIHGSGDVAASDFACDSAEVEINGSGSVELAEIGALAVEIHGSGDVSYRGEPKLRRMDIHGSGGVHRL